MTEERKQALTSLRTCKGQIEGIIKMIEDERYCIDISNQIMASLAILKRANKLILTGHMKTCIHEAITSEVQVEEKTKELISVISKLIDGK